MTDSTDTPVDLAAIADVLRRRGHVRGDPVGISLFAGHIPPSFVGAMVEPCAIVRHAMDLGERVYVDASHHACLSGAWQAGFIEPPLEIRTGRYLATNTPFFTEAGAERVKTGENVIPLGTFTAIGAAPLDDVPEGVDVDWIVTVCEPNIAAMIGGVRVAIDGTPPRGAAGTSLCGDIFALPFHESDDPNVIISTGDVGGRMFNKVKPSEMFVLIPMAYAHMIPTVLTARPDLGGLMEAIKPGYIEARDRKRAERAARSGALEWDDDVSALLAQAPPEIREFAGPTLEEYARDHGHDRISMDVMEAQMESVGMRLSDITAMLGEDDEDAGTDATAGTGHGPESVDESGDGSPADAPVRARATIHIEASADVVWTTLSDASRWPSWYPDIRTVRSDGPLVETSTFMFKTGPVTIRAAVDEARAPSVLVFTGRGRGSVAVYRFTIAARGDGSEVVAIQTMSGLAATTMRPMMQKIAETSLPQWLDALRVEAERPG